MYKINVINLTNMQNYRTKDLADLAIAAISGPLETPEDRVTQWLLRCSTSEEAASIKMSTPTPVSMEDRELITVPLGTGAKWPDLDAFLNAAKPESTSAYQDLGDIIQQVTDCGSDDLNNQITVPYEDLSLLREGARSQCPTILPDPALQIVPGISKSEEKKSVPSASKDEWPDSSDDEPATRVGDNGSYTSEYFRPTTADNTKANPRKRAKTTDNHRNPRFHSISGSKPTGVHPLSMSKNAIDYRDRKEIARGYKEKVCALIDQDILDRVDSEGGITPEGRMYKAVLQMMERRQRHSALQQVTTPPNSSPGSDKECTKLRQENQALRRRIQEASRVLGSQ